MNREDRDIQGLAVRNPDEYNRLVQGFHNLAGTNGSPREDLRVTAIARPTHLDRRRYSMGLPSLTERAGSLRAQDFMVIGAITGHGKTSLAERIAMENARTHRVLFASLEMPAPQIQDRMLAKLMRVTKDDVVNARAEDSEDYCTAYSKLSELDLMVWAPERRPERTIQKITKRALDVTAAMLIIDYTRMIAGWKPGEPAVEIVDYLWEWIKRTGIPTVLLAQIKRDDPGHPRRPTIREYEGTSALETTATHAVILWRPFSGRPAYDNIAEIIVGKNRHGVSFTTHAHWVGPTTDFWDMTDLENEQALCCKERSKKGHSHK